MHEKRTGQRASVARMCLGLCACAALAFAFACPSRSALAELTADERGIVEANDTRASSNGGGIPAGKDDEGATSYPVSPSSIERAGADGSTQVASIVQAVRGVTESLQTSSSNDAASTVTYSTIYTFNANGGSTATPLVKREKDNLYYRVDPDGMVMYSSSETGVFRQAWHLVIDTDYEINLMDIGSELGITREGYRENSMDKYYNTKPDGSGFNVDASVAKARDAFGGEHLTRNQRVILYMNWIPNRYTVTYDANGGVGAPGSIEVAYGTEFQLPSEKPTREGYEFGGWLRVGTVDVYATGQSVENLSAEDGATVKLRALWYRQNATVNYHGWRGSTFTPGDETVAASSRVPVTLPQVNKLPDGQGSAVGASVSIAYDGNGGVLGAVPERSSVAALVKDFTFEGWYTDAEGGTRVGGSGTSFTPQQGVNDLYMQFSEGTRANEVTLPDESVISSPKPTEQLAEYTVTLDANGGETDGIAQSALIARKTRTFEFSGWGADSDGASAAYAPGGTFTPDGPTTLYALWSDSVSVSTIDLPVLQRDGFDFLGWSDSRDAESGVSGTYAPAESETLYAIWKERAITIEFDANGGDGSMEGETADNPAGEHLPPCSFTRAGHLFKGWCTSPDGSGEMLSDGSYVEVSKSVKLYAQWEPVQLTFGVPGALCLKETALGTLVSSSSPSSTIENKSVAGISVTGVGYEPEEGLVLKSDPAEELEYSLWIGPEMSNRLNVADIGQASLASVEWRIAKDSLLALNGVSGKIVRGTSSASGQRQLGTATWRIALHNVEVTFDSNGGEGSMVAQRVPDSVAFTLPKNRFVKGGATFAGWNTASDGTGESYDSDQKVAFADDVTLYAQWR